MCTRAGTLRPAAFSLSCCDPRRSYTRLGVASRRKCWRALSAARPFGDKGSRGDDVDAWASPSADSVTVASSDVESNNAPLGKFWRFCVALYAFSRPHTVAGTVISICSISLVGLQGMEITPVALGALGTSLSAAVLMNVFIVGLNQVFDIAIDKINKPYLPLASGEFTLATAWTVIGVSAVASLMIGVWSGSLPLMVTLVLSMVVGTAYSVDLSFLRWKHNAFAAAVSILVIRAVAVQLGFYFHTQHALGLPTLHLSKELLCAMGLFTYYSIVIALFKDIPDLKGDIKANVRTFTVRLGQKSVFWICMWLLTAMYVSAIAIGLSSNVIVSRIVFPLGNACCLFLLWKRARQANLNVKREITAFYMFVWRLFYLLYFFVPFLRFAA